ncbi:unnamed protein product, partial [Symbiodinium pilosum]
MKFGLAFEATIGWTKQRVRTGVPTSHASCQRLSFLQTHRRCRSSPSLSSHFMQRCLVIVSQIPRPALQDLGYVNGDVCKPFLRALTYKVNETADYFNAERVLAMGYSMGGFGAIQLGCWAPETYDAVISLAGYGMGTRAPTEISGAPQPKGRRVFEWYLDEYIPKLADVPIVWGVHSQSDGVSSFNDVRAIVDRVSETARRTRKRCNTRMIEVSADDANTDYPRKRRASASGHGYFNVTLLKDRSEHIFWEDLRTQLSRSAKRQRRRWDMPPEAENR